MTHEHISSAFDRDLEGIQARIMKMGGLVEQAILDSAQALETRDQELAEQVRANDKVIDELEELLNEEAARVKALCDDHGVTVRCIGSPIGKSPLKDPIDTELGNLDRIAAIAAIVGRPRLLCGETAFQLDPFFERHSFHLLVNKKSFDYKAVWDIGKGCFIGAD